MLIECFSLGPVETNCILVISLEAKKGAIIDAPVGSADIIAHLADEYGIEFTHLLLTHTHWDHTADAAAIKDKLNPQVFVHKLDAENLEKPGSDLLPMYFPIQPLMPDKLLDDGDQFSIGDLQFRVIHTPGHSPGSVCYYLEKEGVLLSGDTLFQGTYGRVDFLHSDPEKMKKSLTLLSQLPPDTEVYPGHGDKTTISSERWLFHDR